MIEQFIFWLGAPVAETEKRRVVAECRRDLGLRSRLCRMPAHARDHGEGPARTGGRGACLVHRELEDRTIESHRGIADRELGGMHTDGDATCTCIHIVARESALPS